MSKPSAAEQTFGWKVEKQALMKRLDGKSYDALTVKRKDGTVREFCFDVTWFYGKF